MSKTLYELAEDLYNNAVEKQDLLYEEIVMEALINDPDNIDSAMQKYNECINFYDIKAYRKVVQIIFNEIIRNDSSKFDYYQLRFKAIGRYAQFRNEFTTKCREVLKEEGNSKDKNDLIAKMDRRRSEQHDLIISLFNEINEIADKNKIRRPYISNKLYFNKKNPDDRNSVAQIVKVHEPLNETLRLFNYFSEKNLK